MEISIENLTKEDVESVIEINNNSFTTDAWNKEGFYREFSLEYSRKWVLKVDEKVVGYIVVWVQKPEAFIMTFAIDKNYRGKGLGERLIRFCEEKLKEEGVSLLELDVRKSNLAAINLYKKLGFRIERERPKFYSDGEDAFVMQKEL